VHFLISLFLLTSAAWVYTDARRRDWQDTRYRRWSPPFWGAMTFLLWIVVFPNYLAVRSTAPPKSAPSTVDGPRKRCPECSEVVQSTARTCRFCRHQFVGRTRWPRAVAITAVIFAGWLVVGAYAQGRLDAPLSRFGLNTRDCMAPTFGRTLCGDDAVAFCREFYSPRLNGEACRPVLRDAGQPLRRSV
jgi:hypothetical protein